MVTWDEAKRQANLRSHGIDFVDCDAVFDSPVFAWDDDREAYGELRINPAGLAEQRCGAYDLYGTRW